MTTIWDPNNGNTNLLDGVVIGSLKPAAATFTTVKTQTGSPGHAASVTASTTQTLVGATQLIIGVNLVNAANASDAVKLPPALAGTTVDVITVGSTATPQIFPGVSGDTIDGGSSGASVNLTAAHRGATFRCAVAGNWVSSLYGAVAS